jgi:hypothetical protein
VADLTKLAPEFSAEIEVSMNGSRRYTAFKQDIVLFWPLSSGVVPRKQAFRLYY